MAIDIILMACLAISFLYILHQAIFLRRRRPSLPLPPGPRGFPILGALPLLGPLPHSGLAHLARRYGPIMYLKMGTRSTVVASSASAASAFLKTFDLQFANRPSSVTANISTFDRQDLVLADYGPKWKLLRRLSTLHLLGNKALAGWAPARRAEADHLVRSLCELARADRPVVLPELLVCTIANILGHIMLSQRVFDAQGKASHEFKEMILETMSAAGIVNIGDFVPAIAWLDLQGIQAKLRKTHAKFDEMISKMMRDHRERARDGADAGPADFLDHVMAHRNDDGGENLSDENIKGLIFDMFTAGTDTTAIIIEWAIAEMLKNPAILNRAQAEMDRVIGKRRRLEESDLPNLPYFRAVCKEALRKHPSTTLSVPHFTFDECSVGGYRIPKNTTLLVNIWAIGRDPDVWKNPLEFDPERFLTGEGAKLEAHGSDFEFIPFGAGRRICAGKQAGMVLLQYILGTLVHSFDWRLPDGEEEVNMDEAPGLTVPKAVPLSALASPRLESAVYV